MGVYLSPLDSIEGLFEPLAPGKLLDRDCALAIEDHIRTRKCPDDLEVVAAHWFEFDGPAQEVLARLYAEDHAYRRHGSVEPYLSWRKTAQDDVSSTHLQAQRVGEPDASHGSLFSVANVAQGIQQMIDLHQSAREGFEEMMALLPHLHRFDDLGRRLLTAIFAPAVREGICRNDVIRARPFDIDSLRILERDQQQYANPAMTGIREYVLRVADAEGLTGRDLTLTDAVRLVRAVMWSPRGGSLTLENIATEIVYLFGERSPRLVGNAVERGFLKDKKDGSLASLRREVVTRLLMSEVAAVDGDQYLAVQYRVDAADKLRFLGDTRAIRELRMRHYANALELLRTLEGDAGDAQVLGKRVQQTMEDIATRGNQGARKRGHRTAPFRLKCGLQRDAELLCEATAPRLFDRIMVEIETEMGLPYARFARDAERPRNISEVMAVCSGIISKGIYRFDAIVRAWIVQDFEHWSTQSPLALDALRVHPTPGMERLLRMLHAAARMQEREIDSDGELTSLSLAHLSRVVECCQNLFDDSLIAKTVALAMTQSPQMPSLDEVKAFAHETDEPLRPFARELVRAYDDIVGRNATGTLAFVAQVSPVAPGNFVGIDLSKRWDLGCQVSALPVTYTLSSSAALPVISLPMASLAQMF